MYLKDSNAAAHSVDSDIFCAVIHLQPHAGMMTHRWRNETRDRDKKKQVQVYAHCLHTDLLWLDIKRYTSTSRLQYRENDVKIVGVEI